VNGSKEVGGFTLVCQQFGNGTVIFHGAKSMKPYQQKVGASGYTGAASDSAYGSYSSPVMRCMDENGMEVSLFGPIAAIAMLGPD
jgi:hypothetical protein